MRRLTVWIVSTVTGVVLLFSYHTSTSGPAGGKVVAGVAPVGVVAESPGVDAAGSPVPASASVPAVPSPVAASTKPGAAAPTVTAPRRTSQQVGPGPSPAAVPARQATRAPSPSPSPSPKPKATTASTRTINGAPADTRYGPVQVQIKVRGSRILSSDAIVYPTSERRDQEINSRAVPQLNQETLDAQSAQIDTVSGASYTSEGYRESLQSALDAAHP